MSEAQGFAARYYDGTSSRPHMVRAVIAGDHIQIRGDTVERGFPLRPKQVSERLGAAPRLIHFADGGYLETDDHAAMEAALASAGMRDNWLARIQNHWRPAVVALLLSVAAIAVGYVYGLPRFSEFVAYRLSPELEAALGRRSVQIIDARLFTPSRLPQTRRDELAARFVALAPHDSRRSRIEFRASKIGPNALALPGGVIIITDELVRLAPSDEAVIGVLAHELGHIERRHFLRRLISGTVTGAVATLITGDASGVMTALPATLADLSYSRDMEREADAFAVNLLRANGLPPSALADMLERLETEHAKRHSGGQASKAAREQHWTDYVSSHPPANERLEAIRGRH